MTEIVFRFKHQSFLQLWLMWKISPTVMFYENMVEIVHYILDWNAIMKS